MVGLDDLEVEVTVVLGRAQMSLHDFLQLGRGAVVAFDAAADDRVDILANGHAIARGDVTVTGTTIAVELRELIGREVVLRDPGATLGGARPSAASSVRIDAP